MSRTFCKAHCRLRACHSHFANNGTFDAHRIFEDPKDHDWDRRTCADLEEDPRFAVKTHEGTCAVASGISRHPVRIWTLTTYLESRPSWGLVRRARRAS